MASTFATDTESAGSEVEAFGASAHASRPGRRASTWLRVVAIAAATIFAFPAIYVLWRTFGFVDDLSGLGNEVAAPLARTILLATLVSISGAALATGLAFLLGRTDLPGRRMLHLLLLLPLVLPSFVGAAAFLAAIAPGGLVYEAMTTLGLTPPRRFRGLGPAWLVLTVVTYPYVLLPVMARLTSVRVSLEENARVLGDTALQAFVRITLPQLRPAILAGSLIAFLYTISDFGAVQLLGYDTLTRVIFASKLAQRALAFGAATVLLMLAWIVSTAERKASRAASVDGTVRARAATTIPLGRWKLFLTIATWGVVFATLIAPLSSLVLWAVRGIANGQVNASDLLGPLINTALVGLVTAVVAVLAVLPLAVLVVRYRSRLGSLIGIGVVAGFAVPGLVIALALVFWGIGAPFSSWIYQRLPLLILAYVVHFGALALGSTEDAVRAVPMRVIEASRMLGSSTSDRVRRVDLPLMRPSLAAGGGLVLLATVKELPATLLLAPTGFDTLATEIWGSLEDARFGDASVSALVLVAVSAALTYGLVLRGGLAATPSSR